MGIVEEFEGLVTGVDDGRDDPQVLQSIDIGLEGRDLDGQVTKTTTSEAQNEEKMRRRW